MIMRLTVIFLSILVSAPLYAQTADAFFDFNKPESLNPPLTTPELKQWIDLDGRTFTSGAAEISFVASENGNTHVRLYHPYDAECDVRIYDSESLNVRSTDPDLLLREIKFEMSLSGVSAGSADINFAPSCGTFDWAAETWTAGADGVTEVLLTSIRQSRIASMTVKFTQTSSAVNITAAEQGNDSAYYSLTGNKLSTKPSQPGIYIRVSKSGKAQKYIVR